MYRLLQVILSCCFLSWYGLQLCFANNSPKSESYLLLYNILCSHGSLKPAFSPKTFNYQLQLHAPLQSINIVPEFNMSVPEYENGRKLPVVTLKTDQSSKISHGNNQILIQSSVSAVQVTIDLFDPDKFQNKKSYLVKVIPYKKTALAALTKLDVVQSTGASAIVSNLFKEKVILAYVNPEATFVTFKPTCVQGNTVKVNGNKVAVGEQQKILRDKTRYRQMVVVSCEQNKSVKNYVVLVVSTLRDKEIPEPRLVVNQQGQECVVKKNKSQLFCESPKSKDAKAQLFSLSSLSTVHYTLETQNQELGVRIIDQFNTAFFPVTSTPMQLVAKAGLGEKVWKVHFVALSTPFPIKLLALILGFLLLLLLLSVFLVCGVSSLFGIGTPIGMTNVASTMLLLLQFLIYTQQYHGNEAFEKFVQYAKWVTGSSLFPWDENFFAFNFDVTALQNAYGCLYWCGVLLGAISCIHVIITFLFYYAEGRTFPHRMRLGAWEQRILHALVLPLAYASSLIWSHPESTLYWKNGALVCFGSLILWIIVSSVNIKSKIDTQSVTWVWQYPLNEQQEYKDNEAGYWSDVVCDQLCTQPVNRSFCADLLPWRWTAVVADIEPVNICVGLLKRGTTESTESYPMFADPYGDGAIPFGTVAKRVDVLQTVPPNNFCPGQRLICGLLRCSWLDILYTYQALTNYYAARYVDMKRSYATIPLTVKTCQLTGPITNGINLFFFDGIRSPYVRVYELFFRCVIGACLGLSNNQNQFLASSISFAICAISGAILLLYYLSETPYVKTAENLINFCATLAITSISALMLGTLLELNFLPAITKFTFYTVAIALTCLTVYTAAIIFVTYSAVMCPPLEEIKLLENCANCTVVVSDHLEEWSVEMPGYAKKKVKDLKAQCSLGEDFTVRMSVFPSGSEPSIEFSTDEILVACSTETLPVPLLALFLPDSSLTLGYRWTNVYDARNAHAQIRSFIEQTPKYKVIAESVAKTIAHQIEASGNLGKTVLAITIIPPKSLKH